MSDPKKMLSRISVLLVILVLISSVALAALNYPFFTVTTKSVRMRRSASSGATVLENLDAGASVEVLGKTGNYYKVKFNNRTGYVHQDYISTDKSDVIHPTAEPMETVGAYPYDTVTKDTVNLRQSRSTRSALLKKIPEGAKISVKSVSGTWAEVTYGSRTGYLKTDYIVLKKVTKVKATPTPKPVPTLSPEESAGGYAILQKGSSGNEVRALQNALIELGFLTGKADGKFGSGTEKAVIAFQKANGYPDTGIMDANIQAFLYSGKPKDSKGTKKKINTLSPASGASMKLNNVGDAVGELQQRLKELGYYKGSVSNTYDTATKKAVIAFQKMNGLTADGIATQATQKKLYADSALAADTTPTPKPTATPTPEPTFTIPKTTVKQNSAGSDAKLVQKRLKQLGYYSGSVDGKFSGTWVKALKSFQETNGLKADGIAGKDTYNILFSTAALKKGAKPTATPEPETEKTAEAAYTTLRKGMSGADVTLMQEALINLGYLSGKSDGNFGEKTVSALKAFQKNNGLTADGVAGSVTLTRLYSAGAKSATPKTTTTPKPEEKQTTLKKGTTGTQVKEMQNRLIKLGYLSGSADGIFGTATYKAVLAFQKANQLKADGIAGSGTLKALSSSSAVAATAAPKTTQTTAAVGSTNTSVKPDASKVIYANWYTTTKAVAKQYPYATVYDYSTGISWQVHIFSLGAHADFEPLTANDTSKMVKALGGRTWNPKAVWVIFSNGKIYMASIHSMPHEVQHITDNNFAGHACIHFPRTAQQVADIGPYATRHQSCIDAGWAKTQAMAN